MLIDQLFFNSNARILNTNNVSLLMSALQVCHLITLLGLDLVIISLGSIYSKKESTLAQGTKIWLYSVLAGLISAIGCFLLTKSIDTNAIYCIFLPIIRNVSPVVTGIILSLICYPFLKKVNTCYLKIILMMMVLLPVFNGQDIFGFGNGYSTSFTFVLFYLGAIDADQKITYIPFIIIGLLDVLCAGFMPLCSDIVHGDMSTALRFTTSTSFFEVFIALEIVRLLSHISFTEHDSLDYLPIASLILIGANRLTTFISWNEGLVGTTSKKLLLLAVWEALAVIMFFIILNALLIKIPGIYKLKNKINQHFKSFSLSNEWLKKELQLFKSFLKKNKTRLMMLLLAYIFSFISFIVMNASLTINPINTTLSYNVFFYIFFRRQFFVLLNTFILVLVAHFLMIFTRRYWVSGLLTGFMEIVVIVANYLKILFRDEPIIPADLAMIKALKSLLVMMGTGVIILAVVLIVVVVALIIYLEKKHPLALHMSLRRSVMWILVTIIFFSSTLVMNHDGNYLNMLMRGLGDEPYFYNQLYGAKVNGPVLQFLNNIDISVMDNPINYNKKLIQKIATKYQKQSNVINKYRKNDWDNQIIIMGLSESFADPSRIPELTLSNDPIPYIRSLMQSTTSGLMYSAGYGGGTANMEYMALTGFNLGLFSSGLTPYTQLVPRQSYAYAFSRLFNQAVAIHPYIGVFYSRQTVYNNFGFNKFMYLGSQYKIKHQSYIDRSLYLSDETAYANTIDEIVNAKGSKFINLVTMQNHMPYDKNVYDHKDQFIANGNSAIDENFKDRIEEYAMGLHYTDQAVKNFIEKLDSIEKPITYVFYGDHLPGIYWDSNPAKYNSVFHETDYFIYSNKYAREHLNTRTYSSYDLVSPTDFMSLVQKQTRTKTTPYTALLETVLDELPAITTKSAANSTGNSNIAFINEKGQNVKYKDLTSDQKQLLKEYKLVQYDMTVGNNYLKDMDFFK